MLCLARALSALGRSRAQRFRYAYCAATLFIIANIGELRCGQRQNQPLAQCLRLRACVAGNERVLYAVYATCATTASSQFSNNSNTKRILVRLASASASGELAECFWNSLIDGPRAIRLNSNLGSRAEREMPISIARRRESTRTFLLKGQSFVPKGRRQ